MNWKASRPTIEVAVEWIAAACLGGAVSFAVARIAPSGAGVAVALGAIVAAAALAVLARIDRRRGTDEVSFEAVAYPGEDEADAALLLDDPLPAIAPDSRVVRLFASEAVGATDPSPLSGPGEMIARIENYLGVARGSAAAAEPARSPTPMALPDASAALHAALADIRRSLRQ